MGWLTTHNTSREDQVNELIKDSEFDSCLEPGVHIKNTTLAHCYRRKHPGAGTLWAVVHHVKTDKDGNVIADQKIVVCNLLAYDRGVSGWGYKGMDETAGPYEHDCPLAYLDMSTLTEKDGEFIMPWRQRVREYWADRQSTNNFRRELKVGDYLKLKNCTLPYVQVVATGRTLMGTYAGRRYKVGRRHIDRLMTEQELSV